MSFTAKFGGTCAKCAGHIPAGSKVNYDGHAIRHAPRCPAKGTVTEVPPPQMKELEPLTPASEILGKAEYKGHEYLMIWEGETKRGGRAAKLAFRDGSKVFWADAAAYRVVKRYREPITLRRLQQLAEEYREQKQAEKANDTAAAALTEDKLREMVAGIGSSLVEPARDVGFTRDGKASVKVGERVTWTRKDKTKAHGIVVRVERSYYHSEEECEDMDCFCRQYGWRTPYAAREIAATAEQAAAEAESARRAARKAEVEQLLRASYGADTHIDSAPAGVTMTDLLVDARPAGSERYSLGSDGVVYYMRSDYDMGPSWWRTSATAELVAEAKELGVKP